MPHESEVQSRYAAALDALDTDSETAKQLSDLVPCLEQFRDSIAAIRADLGSGRLLLEELDGRSCDPRLLSSLDEHAASVELVIAACRGNDPSAAEAMERFKSSEAQMRETLGALGAR